LLAELIVLSARSRRESRGLHYTLDHPAILDKAVDTVVRRGATRDGTASWEPGAGSND